MDNFGALVNEDGEERGPLGRAVSRSLSLVPFAHFKGTFGW